MKILVLGSILLSVLAPSSWSVASTSRSVIKTISWTGKYRQVNGAHDLLIDEWEAGQLSVDIVKAGSSPDNHENVDARFLAEVKGEVATWSSISPYPMKLKRVKDGIIVLDPDKGINSDNGLYKPVQ